MHAEPLYDRSRHTLFFYFVCSEKSVSPKDGTYEKIFWENFPNVGLSKVECEQGFESGFQISLDPDPVSDRDPGAKKSA